MMCPGDPHQRKPNAPKFEDRSQEETEWQERCAREAAWRLAKNILKLKAKIKQHSSHLRKIGACLRHQILNLRNENSLSTPERCLHMISKKDLNFSCIGNRDDIEKSDDGCYSQWWSADAWRGHSLRQRIGKFLNCESPRGYASSSIARKALRWTQVLLRVDQRSKTTSHWKRYSDTMQHGELRSDRGYQRVLPQACLLQISMTPSRQEIDHPTSSSSSPTSPPMTSSTVSSESVARQERRDLCFCEPQKISCWLSQPKIQNPNQNEDHDQERRDPFCSEITEWLREFRENLVDDRVPEHRDSHASSSHEPSLEPTPTRSADLGEHSVETHFPKDRNCEICQRTKITRAPSRKRIGRVVLRAEIFGDLITDDHNVLSEDCESRNNHRYAVVVQDLATQWIQSYPYKTKSSQETQRSLQTFLEPDRKRKVIYTNNSMEFGKSLWRSFLKSLYVDTRQIGNKWDCWESSTQSKGRHLCCIVAIGSKWKLVGRFYGMSHLSAKRHRSIIWWEDAQWKTFWATI